MSRNRGRAYPQWRPWLVIALILITCVTPWIAKAQEKIVSTVRAGDLLFAPVSIEHSPVTWWLVDTGASISEFDLQTAQSLRLKPAAHRKLVSDSANKGERLYLLEASDFSLGSIECGPSLIVARSLIETLDHLRTPVVPSGRFERTGLLGMNVLLRERALIPWNQQCILLDPAKSRLAYEAEGYTAVPFKITANRQIDVEGTIGSHRYQFCLDTGSSRTTLEQAVVDLERLPSEPTKSIVRSPTKEFGDSNVRAAIPTKFKLGEFDLSNHKVNSAALHLTIRDKGELWAGLIAADLLREYDAIIDLGSDVLYLRNKSLRRPAITGGQ